MLSVTNYDETRYSRSASTFMKHENKSVPVLVSQICHEIYKLILLIRFIFIKIWEVFYLVKSSINFLIVIILQVKMVDINFITSCFREGRIRRIFKVHEKKWIILVCGKWTWYNEIVEKLGKLKKLERLDLFGMCISRACSKRSGLWESKNN